jgi:hypothetical protein
MSLVVGIAEDLFLLLPNLGFLPKGFSYYTCPNFRYKSLLLTIILVVLEQLYDTYSRSSIGYLL